MSSTLNSCRFSFLNMETKTLPERLREILSDQRLSQAELARAAGMTKGWMSQLLSGEGQSLDYEYALSIHNKYGYSVPWLISGRPPKFSKDVAAEPAPAHGAAALTALYPVIARMRAELEELERLVGSPSAPETESHERAGRPVAPIRHRQPALRKRRA